MTAASHTADRVIALTLAAGAMVVVAALGVFWGANPGYADRLLILAGAAWAAWTQLPAWSRLPVVPRPWLGLPPAALGCAAFACAVFLLAQIGPRTLLLWWLGGAWVAATAGVVLARLGVPRLRAALFALLFPLFALPIPGRVLNPLQERLQALTTSLAHRTLTALGEEVERDGFVLGLPGGKLHVEEACSGVRSVTALTALAAFVAFLKGFGPGRGVVLVTLTVPVVALVNVLRVVLSGLIQEWAGANYVRDTWHEALGLAMVFVGLGLILGLARLLGGGRTAEAPLLTPPVLAAQGGWGAATLLLLAAGVTGIAAWQGQTAHARAGEVAPLADIPTRLGAWQGEDLPIPPVVPDLLAPDVALYRRYINNVGQEGYVWAFYWASGAAIKGYHHPDICWGNRGFVASERWRETVALASGPCFGATAREFRQEREEQVVYYWTQEGPHVWADADEAAARAEALSSSWTGHRWVGDLLGVAPREVGARLQVVVIVPAAGRAARRDATALAGQVAEELYRVCPWATPR